MEDNIDLKIKFVQTDLTDREFIYKKMMQYGHIVNPSVVYENSDYISKLHFMNNYTGGSIVKKENEINNSELNTGNDSKSSDETPDKNINKAYKPDDYFIYYDSDHEDDGEETEAYEDYDEYEDDEDDNSTNELKIEFNTTGRMSVSKSQITISYDESDLCGFDNAMVNIVMDSKNPDIIIIQKDNFMKSTLTFEKEKRSISDYDSNYPAVMVAVKTLKMVNNMTQKGGEINLLYTVEANGSPTEMVSYSLSAQRRLSK